MSKLRLKISMSLDGVVAGPNQSEQDPIGVGGMELHNRMNDPLRPQRSYVLVTEELPEPQSADGRRRRDV